MRARDLAEPAPIVGLDDSVADALRLIQDGAPGVAVVDEAGALVTVLPATQVLRLALPSYMRGHPGLARAWDEAHADRFAESVQTTLVREALGGERPAMTTVNEDDTAIEIAMAMCDGHAPLIMVVKDGRPTGAIRLRALLSALLPGHGALG